VVSGVVFFTWLRSVVAVVVRTHANRSVDQAAPARPEDRFCHAHDGHPAAPANALADPLDR